MKTDTTFLTDSRALAGVNARRRRWETDFLAASGPLLRDMEERQAGLPGLPEEDRKRRRDQIKRLIEKLETL